MNYFRTCPDCGANLDPDEACDCKRKSPDRSHGTGAKEILSPTV